VPPERSTKNIPVIVAPITKLAVAQSMNLVLDTAPDSSTLVISAGDSKSAVGSAAGVSKSSSNTDSLTGGAVTAATGVGAAVGLDAGGVISTMLLHLGQPTIWPMSAVLRTDRLA
jgi:hypothetical protein